MTGFEFGKEINAVFDPSATADRPTTDLTWYLRIVRCGQTYHGYYSLDGVTYTLIGTHRGTTFTVTHFGLTAFNGQGLTPGEKNFDFDFFHADYPGTASPVVP